jgi:hypothetical protein
MKKPLLHIFRNTPFGRETLLQSAYFCHRTQLPLSIYLPESKSFLLYFDSEVVQVDLDDREDVSFNFRNAAPPCRI